MTLAAGIGPLRLRLRDVEEFIPTVKVPQPTFGGINLEDIAPPRLIWDADYGSISPLGFFGVPLGVWLLDWPSSAAGRCP